MKYIVYILFFVTILNSKAKTISKQEWENAKKDFIYDKNVEVKQEEKNKKEPIKNSNYNNTKWDFSFLSFLNNPAILYGIAIIILLVILFFLFKNYTLPQKLKKESVLYHSDSEIEEKLLETDIDRWLNKALAEGNYQMAIRYTYLKTLKTLVEKNKIKWKKQYTNRDYLVQLYQSNLFEPFKNITLIYERKWYRNDLSDKEEFDSFTTNCNFITSIA